MSNDIVKNEQRWVISYKQIGLIIFTFLLGVLDVNYFVRSASINLAG